MHTTPPSLLMRVRDPSDQAAWAEFDQRYREWLIRYFRRRGVPFPDAEDLVQRVFAALVRSLPQFIYDPQQGRFRNYLFRCAQNALRAWGGCPDRNHRALDASNAPSSGADADDDPAAARVWEEEWVAHHLRLALSVLRAGAPARDVQILERSMAGAAVAELARDLGMAADAVYKARQRIRHRLEQLVAAQIAEEDRTA